MKSLLSLLVLGLAVALTAPAFAADAPKVPMTKADCDKTKDMKWDKATAACIQSSASSGTSEGTSGKTSDRTRAMHHRAVPQVQPVPAQLAPTLARLRAARLIGLRPSNKDLLTSGLGRR